MNRRLNGMLLPCLLLGGMIESASSFHFLASRQESKSLTVTPFKDGGIYGIGERAGWTITLAGLSQPLNGPYSYVLKKNNMEVIKSGQLDFVSGKAVVETSLREPAMLYLQLVPPPTTDTDTSGGFTTGPRTGRSHVATVYGAAIAPSRLRPVVNRPPDFDAFWNSKIKLLKAIPENPVLTPSDCGNPAVDYATLKMDHINGAHVYGQIAKPKGKTKLPAILMLQWASPPYPLNKYWILGYAAQGWLILDIEPHDVLPDQPQAYYNGLPSAIKNYTSIGQDDREKNYFLQMYLADYRAVDYLASRPDWDGKTLVVLGTSMGGQQSLCVAGLHPKVTHVIVNEPSGCDLNAALHGRQSGYPNFPSNSPKVMETARYFDAVNFASHIRATSLVAMGFVDSVAPPAGIWTAFNQIRGPKEAAPMFDSPHNNTATPSQQQPFTSRSAEWLDTLLAGNRVTPRPNRFP